MTSRGSARPDTARPDSARQDTVWVFLATLAVHGLVALTTPAAGNFAKYTVAVAGLRDGTVSPERTLDFSPLYLGLAKAASTLAGWIGGGSGVEPGTLLLGLQLLLAALAVSCFHRLVARRLGRALALAAAAMMALDSHLLVYWRILEPETLLLALLLGLLVLLERPGPAVAAAAGLLAALAVATRPTFLPLFFLVPLWFRMQESPLAPLLQRGEAEESPLAPLLQRGEAEESPLAPLLQRGEAEESPLAPLFQRGEPRQGPPSGPPPLKKGEAEESPLAPLFQRGEPRQGPPSGPPPLKKGELEGDFPPGDWRRRGALFLAPVVLCLVLLSWRAHRVSGSWTSPVMNPGTVFYEGNQPLSRGTSAVYPPSVMAMVRKGSGQPDAAHEHYRQVARAVEPAADMARVNALWSGRARAYLADQPGLALHRLRTKILYALHGFSWHDVPTAWRLDGLLPLPTLPMSVLSAAALLGLAVEARRWRRALPFYALAAVQLAVMSVFYVSARQRLVLLPALVYFALCAVRSLFGGGRSWTWHIWIRRILVSLLLLVLALPLAVPDEAMLDAAYQHKAFAEAEHRLEALRTPGTPLAAQRPALVAALATAPWSLDQIRPAWVPQDDATLDERVADELERRLRVDPRTGPTGLSAAFDLATVQLSVGRLERAEELLDLLVESGFRAYRGGRQPSDPRILLARVDAARGDLDAARATLDEVLADAPGDLFALSDRAALEPGNADVEALDRYAGEADRRWLLGRALLRIGRPEAALEQLEPLAASLPELREVHVYLGLALAGVESVEEAAESILRANRIGPEPVLEVRAVAEVARRWAEDHPDDARVQLLAIRLLHQHGMIRDARRRLDELERLDLSPSDRRQVEEIRARLGEAVPTPR